MVVVLKTGFFYVSMKILLGFSGVVTLLKYPYPRHMEEPSQYETVRLHIELGPPVSPSYQNPQLSVRTPNISIDFDLNSI